MTFYWIGKFILKKCWLCKDATPSICQVIYSFIHIDNFLLSVSAHDCTNVKLIDMESLYVYVLRFEHSGHCRLNLFTLYFQVIFFLFFSVLCNRFEWVMENIHFSLEKSSNYNWIFNLHFVVEDQYAEVELNYYYFFYCCCSIQTQSTHFIKLSCYVSIIVRKIITRRYFRIIHFMYDVGYLSWDWWAVKYNM